MCYKNMVIANTRITVPTISPKLVTSGMTEFDGSTLILYDKEAVKKSRKKTINVIVTMAKKFMKKSGMIGTIGILNRSAPNLVINVTSGEITSASAIAPMKFFITYLFSR